MPAMRHHERGAAHRIVMIRCRKDDDIGGGLQRGRIDAVADRDDAMHGKLGQRVDRVLEFCDRALLGHRAEADEDEWRRIVVSPRQRNSHAMALALQDRADMAQSVGMGKFARRIVKRLQRRREHAVARHPEFF